MRRHYDVIVLGRSLGALTAAAILARRDFTVLVLGNGSPAPSYQAAGHELPRHAFSFLGAASPCWQRVLSELAQSQTFRRRLMPQEPALQALWPGSRVDITNQEPVFAREIDREFPELYHVVAQLYQTLDLVNQAADEAFEKDAMWPPGTFWERRETAKVAARLPYVHAEPDADLLAEFPRGHFYRRLVRASVLFGTNFSTIPPPFAVARLHTAWRRAAGRLEGGEGDLEGFLAERVTNHGGQCHLKERASSIHLRLGVAAGVVVEGDDQPTGCEFVLSDLDGESIATLAGGQGIHKGALREWPRITSTAGRFVVSLVVRSEGLPDPLAAASMLFVDPSRVPRGAPGVVHLVRTRALGGVTVLTAEVMLTDHGALPLPDARRFVFDAISRELPFIEQHLLVVDSPNDGLPVWVYERGVRREVARRDMGLSPIEPMVRQLEVDPPGYLGFSGEPIRGPIERTLLLGRSVLPGLGQEGELLAAWGAARLVTRSDRKKALMRRDTWTKLEIG